MVLEKTLESLLDCKETQLANPKGNQSWVFIGGTDDEAETQYFGHLMWRADSLEKTLILGKIEGERKRGRKRMRWLDGITDSMDMGLVMDSEAWRAAVHGVTKSWTRLRDWTELNWTEPNMHLYILCSPHSIEYQNEMRGQTVFCRSPLSSFSFSQGLEHA